MTMRACAVIAALSLAVALPAAAGAKLKLPAERTSPTGNFFTLEKYRAPTKSKRVANFYMKICTSSHTPKDTAIDPMLFTVDLKGGGDVSDSIELANSPVLGFKPLKPLECGEGWLGFSIPKGKSVLALAYHFGGTISWKVG